MRAKRSKQYKKLMQQFALHHGFREPYQVLVDADLVRDAARFTMDLQPALERTLHGQVKVMISQCSMRHLYAQGREPGMDRVIEKAKEFERRRCGHRPDTHPEPLSTMECLLHCVDDKGRGENKNRYVVATQDQEVRRRLRQIPGVPLIYIARSVMIMEPMSTATSKIGTREEKLKLKGELKRTASTAGAAGTKRKRGDDEGDSSDESGSSDDEKDESGGEKEGQGAQSQQPERKKKKRTYGPKGPNPLSIKKAKKKPAVGGPSPSKKQGSSTSDAAGAAPSAEGSTEKKKRKRKHKARPQGEEGGGEDGVAPEPAAAPAAAGEA